MPEPAEEHPPAEEAPAEEVTTVYEEQAPAAYIEEPGPPLEDAAYAAPEPEAESAGSC